MTEKLTREEIELKPCPFCGPGESICDPWFDDVAKRWRVGCGRCGASSGTHKDAGKAIAAWNRRDMASASLASAGEGKMRGPDLGGTPSAPVARQAFERHYASVGDQSDQQEQPAQGEEPTAAIRVALEALKEITELALDVEARKTRGFLPVIVEVKTTARAAHAKLTEIIEGGGDG